MSNPPPKHSNSNPGNNSPQSSDNTNNARTTSIESLNKGLEQLQANKDRWIATGIDERIAILDEIKRDLLTVTDRWVALSAEAKGIPVHTYGEAFEWSMPAVIFSQLASLRQALKDIKKYGRPQIAGPVLERPDGQVTAKVFPRTKLESMFSPGVSIEVWMEPGVSIEDMLRTQAQIYREGGSQGAVSLILGAGNASAVQVVDTFQKLFVENHVVILKINPIVSYLEPLLKKAFHALISRGFLRIVCGETEEGSYLCRHPIVDDMHLTGSLKTFETIAFGAGAEGIGRKAKKDPLIAKPFTGALGNVTPIIIVPGPWSDDDIRKQAVKIVSWLAFNAGCNCFTPRVLVQHKNWELREALAKAIGDVMANLETRQAFYPGAEERHEAFISAHPNARQFGKASQGHLPWTFIEDVDPGNADDICFKTEAFCSLFAETALEADSIPDFIDKAVDFVNGTLWGTLTATVIIHPKSFLAPEISASLERTLTNLRYGTVSVNEMSAMAYLPGIAPWGGFPGHDIYDAQSGIGFINNCLMFNRPQKTVMRGLFIKKPDPFLVTVRHSVEFMKKYTYYLAAPSMWKLPGMLWALLRG